MKSTFIRRMVYGTLFVLSLVALAALAQSPNGIRGAFTGDVYSYAPWHVYQNTFNSIANCSAVGTAASPSVAACGAAPSGSFSCATNASTATCVVNTTAVTANSQIDVISDSSLGTRLGVTCNVTQTGVSTSVAPISARTAGTSFTIQLSTLTTNPACFSYTITN